MGHSYERYNSRYVVAGVTLLPTLCIFALPPFVLQVALLRAHTWLPQLCLSAAAARQDTPTGKRAVNDERSLPSAPSVAILPHVNGKVTAAAYASPAAPPEPEFFENPSASEREQDEKQSNSRKQHHQQERRLTELECWECFGVPVREDVSRMRGVEQQQTLQPVSRKNATTTFKGLLATGQILGFSFDFDGTVVAYCPTPSDISSSKKQTSSERKEDKLGARQRQQQLSPSKRAQKNQLQQPGDGALAATGIDDNRCTRDLDFPYRKSSEDRAADTELFDSTHTLIMMGRIHARDPDIFDFVHETAVSFYKEGLIELWQTSILFSQHYGTDAGNDSTATTVKPEMKQATNFSWPSVSHERSGTATSTLRPAAESAERGQPGGLRPSARMKALEHFCLSFDVYEEQAINTVLTRKLLRGIRRDTFDRDLLSVPNAVHLIHPGALEVLVRLSYARIQLTAISLSWSSRLIKTTLRHAIRNFLHACTEGHIGLDQENQEERLQRQPPEQQCKQPQPEVQHSQSIKLTKQKPVRETQQQHEQRAPLQQQQQWFVQQQELRKEQQKKHPSAEQQLQEGQREHHQLQLMRELSKQQVGRDGQQARLSQPPPTERPRHVSRVQQQEQESTEVDFRTTAISSTNLLQAGNGVAQTTSSTIQRKGSDIPEAGTGDTVYHKWTEQILDSINVPGNELIYDDKGVSTGMVEARCITIQDKIKHLRKAKKEAWENLISEKASTQGNFDSRNSSSSSSDTRSTSSSANKISSSSVSRNSLISSSNSRSSNWHQKGFTDTQLTQRKFEHLRHQTTNITPSSVSKEDLADSQPCLYAASSSQMWIIYVGDGFGDLGTLLDADIGIFFGNVSTRMKIAFEAAFVKLRPLKTLIKDLEKQANIYDTTEAASDVGNDSEATQQSRPAIEDQSREIHTKKSFKYTLPRVPRPRGARNKLYLGSDPCCVYLRTSLIYTTTSWREIHTLLFGSATHTPS